MKKDFRIGCSGFYYPQWKRAFYPKEIKISEWLTYYSSIFNTVELNGTFYKMPLISTLKKYVAQTPEDFVFSVKMSRYVTHMLKLNNAADAVRDFSNIVTDGLGDKLRNILFQFPASFHYSEEHLELLLTNVPPVEGHVIEFRHISWREADIVKKLRGLYTLCNTDYPGLEHTFDHTNENFYARMHGTPELFKSPYSKEYLTFFFNTLPAACSSYYIYFNNTYFDAAYKNALTLMEMTADKRQKEILLL